VNVLWTGRGRTNLRTKLSSSENSWGGAKKGPSLNYRKDLGERKSELHPWGTIRPEERNQEKKKAEEKKVLEDFTLGPR